MIDYMTSILPNKPLPNLEKEPLLSIQSYLTLLYQLHPSLKDDASFQQHVSNVITSYHTYICEYVKRDGTWMFDSLIPLFMKKMEINIIIISHATGLPITHYPLLSNKYCIYMYHIDSHFESVGKYKNQIMKRVFE
jgi:hypothetical protein